MSFKVIVIAGTISRVMTSQFRLAVIVPRVLRLVYEVISLGLHDRE